MITTTENPGAIPYPRELLDKLCSALGYDRADRQYTYRLFKRHERGKATRPERALIPLLWAMASPVPTEVRIGIGPKEKFEIKVLDYGGMLNSALERAKRAVRLDSCDPKAKSWGLAPNIYVPPGAEIDPELLRRAKSLVRAVAAREVIDHFETLILAASAFYAELPRTWVAWDDHSNCLAGRPPDERRTFPPGAADQENSWLCDAIDRRRTILFLVPLVGPFQPPFAELPVPDLPGPGEMGISPEDLLELPDTPEILPKASNPEREAISSGQVPGDKNDN